MLGLTRYATRAHIARAALEATAFQVREVLEAMQRDAGEPHSSTSLSELRVDGGMVRNELLMQFQADLLGRATWRRASPKPRRWARRMRRALPWVYWESREQLARNWSVAQRWTPAMDEATRTKLYRNWQKAVGRTLDWLES